MTINKPLLKLGDVVINIKSVELNGVNKNGTISTRGFGRNIGGEEYQTENNQLEFGKIIGINYDDDSVTVEIITRSEGTRRMGYTTDIDNVKVIDKDWWTDMVYRKMNTFKCRSLQLKNTELPLLESEDNPTHNEIHSRYGKSINFNLKMNEELN